MAYVIEHKHPKDKALTMVKKAISGKFAIIKDEGFTLKAGAPMTPVTIEVTDTNVTVSGGGMAKMFVDPVGSEIKLYFDENQGGASNSGGNGGENGGCSTQEYLDFQEKGIAVLKSYKELLDSGIISEEEFNAKKTEVLNSMNSAKIQGSNNADAPASEPVAKTVEESCSVNTESTLAINDDTASQPKQDAPKNVKSIFFALLWGFFGLAVAACTVNIILSMALTGSIHGMFVNILDGYLPGYICMAVGIVGFIASLCILIKRKEAKLSKITATIILVAVLCATFVPLTWYDYTLWEKNPDGTYALSDFDPKFVGDYTVASTHNGIPVTRIDNFAFYATGATSITVPETVTSIGVNAFSNAENLKSVTILGPITEISGGAFNWCLKLTSVTIPDSVKTISGRAFYGCSSLESITIPEGLTHIESFAFEGCTSLTSIIIPASVQHIGNDAFRDCPNITVKYCGTEQQWHEITSGNVHECNIIYNYTSE